MIAIIGAAGKVGYSTSSALRHVGLPVRAILRDAAKGAVLREIGCEICQADLQDADALTRAIAGADTVQIIVPVRPQMEDPAEDLRRSIESLIKALTRTRPKRVLAISDYGAHVGYDIGMPTIFRSLEMQLRGLDGHISILRSAEHMHNWGRVVPAALSSGVLPSFQDPTDALQPTISAQDLGRIAAGLLSQPESRQGVEIVHAEGPRRYSANDVAAAISDLTGHTIRAQAVPRSQWAEAFSQMPSSFANLLIKANDAKNMGGLVDVEPNAGDVRHGATELIDALRPLLQK